MKRGLLVLLAFILGILPAVLLSQNSYAADFKNGSNVVIEKNETIDHTLFAAGNNIEINGIINGDIFCAGQNITIDATVNGDIICAGMDIQINGAINGNVRAVAQTVTLSANISRNASLAGNIIHTDSSNKIAGDLEVAGNSLVLNGSVGRDADVAGSMININGMFGRDVQAATNSLNLQSSASINGSLTYYSNTSLSKDSGAHVGGAITKKQPVKYHQERQQNSALNAFISFIMLLSLSFVLLALWPQRLKKLTDLSVKKPLMTLVIGLTACIGVPMVVVVSFLTMIGAFIGIVLLFVWIIVMMISCVLASYYVGRLILWRMPQSPFIVMLTGVVIVSILILIPIVNIISLIAIALFGSGMVVQNVFNNFEKPQYTQLGTSKQKK